MRLVRSLRFQLTLRMVNRFFVKNAIIVVNAASDHEESVEWALGQGCPVLVEKPFCLNFFAAQRLANLALTKNRYLATAHVFLFASYVETFSKLVS